MSVNKVNQSTGALSPIAGGTLYADEPIGAILPFGGGTAPSGFLLCNGAAISRTTYSSLFAVIGTSFGAGDGSTTFNIPDLRDKFPEGASNTNTLGSAKSAGLPNITGNASLGYNDSSAIGVMTRSANGAFVTQKDGSTYWSGPAANIGTYDNSFHFDASRSNSIYGKSTTVQPPAVCVNFIIKATTIALPSDFEDAVDEKIAANIVDNITDGNMKAATSNAIYDALLRTASGVGTKNASVTTSAFTCTVLRKGYVVTMSLDVSAPDYIHSTLLATIPSGFRPIEVIRLVSSCYPAKAGDLTDNGWRTAYGTLDLSGNIRFYTTSGTANCPLTNARLTVTYMTNNAFPS